MWSPAYAGFLRSRALRRVEGCVGGRESDSGRQLGALEIPQVRVLPGNRARGTRGRIPASEAEQLAPHPLSRPAQSSRARVARPIPQFPQSGSCRLGPWLTCMGLGRFPRH